MRYEHETVLLKETVEGLKVKKGGIYVDGTTGGGGHSQAIADRLEGEGLLLCIDQDADALAHARTRLAPYGDGILFEHDNFSNLKSVMERNRITGIDGMVLDLGVSSYQLDNRERGFSYMQDAPLDMRMDKNGRLTAAEVVNTYSQTELGRIIREYGEDNWASRIAAFIVERREQAPIETTGELVEVIKSAIPAKARREGPHPAKRTFQAIRIEVNDELGILENAIKDAVSVMRPGGRLCIITFHSLEDRIVKKTFQYLQLDCICPPELPVCRCDKRRDVKIITRKPILPMENETIGNPRARSAKLRIAERV